MSLESLLVALARMRELLAVRPPQQKLLEKRTNLPELARTRSTSLGAISIEFCVNHKRSEETLEITEMVPTNCNL
jgi:hypothetical protein